MNRKRRAYFDRQLEAVLSELPIAVTRLLDDVPLVVEDHPSRDVLRRLGVRRREHLCGLYTGVPLTRRSIDHSGTLSDVIHLFREGIFAMATGAEGEIDEAELREQIRKTVLHELGHHHGMDEPELRALGY